MTEPHGRWVSELTGKLKCPPSSARASGASVAAAPSTDSALSARALRAAARAAVVAKAEEAPEAAEAMALAEQRTAEQRKVVEAKPLTLLQRLTQQPSPVNIPPHEISLTYLHAFLTADECAELIALVRKAGFPMTGCFSRSLTTSGISDIRTSTSATLFTSHALVRVVRARITELIGVPDRRINELQVVRYDPGQQFTPHFDSSFQFWSLPTPRQLREFSIFVYLNTMPANAGGETEFTKIGVKFTPKAGDALFWRNHKDRHSEHFSDGAHAGRPPTSGVKYGLNVFVTFE